MFDLSLQKKIVAAAMFKGLGDRRFPMYPLINAANTIAQQEATGQMFTMHEDGSATPVGQVQQILPGQVVQQPPAQPVVSPLDILTESITKLSEKVDTLTNHSRNQHNRLRTLEGRQPTPEPGE